MRRGKKLSARFKEAEGQQVQTPSPNPIFIAGLAVGGSTAGLTVLEEFLRAISPDTGIAFLVVQHSAPAEQGMLMELLSRVTVLPVIKAKAGLRLEPNHLYVLPEKPELRAADGRLRLTPRTTAGSHLRIDRLFRSLADDLKEMAVGIVLSGDDSAGNLGLEAVKQAGGITFAHDESPARFSGMPFNATSADHVDFILPAADIARELERITRHPLLHASDGDGAGDGLTIAHPKELFRDGEMKLDDILALLGNRTGVNFSLYEKSRIQNRLIRRMVVQNVEELSLYVKRLKSDVAEGDVLAHNLLSTVSRFFRDPEVYSALKARIFARLLRRQRAELPLRFWVCGCSTGEEAYSLAMALVEMMDLNRQPREAQIFATDISEPALERARAGLYPEAIALDVSAERLRRFFTKKQNYYQVNKRIRDMCVFARHNLLGDAPFSQIDLVSCRNVLVEFPEALRKKLQASFHFSLKRGGILLLGADEKLTAGSELFTLLDQRRKIYAKGEPPFRSGGLIRRRLEVGQRTLLPLTKAPTPEMRDPDLQQQVEKIIPSRFKHPAVVINEKMEVIEFRGRTGFYLEHAAGTPSHNLLKMAREGLVLDLRATVSQAIRKSSPARADKVHVRHNGQEKVIAIEVIPLPRVANSAACYLILFEETPENLGGSKAITSSRNRLAQARMQEQLQAFHKLEEELGWTRNSLQALIEDQEAANEELKAANEEIQSSNEELQSTNEELETAKEELQSVNEELTVVNAELRHRNLELTDANNDLTNLLSSVNMAIILLDNDLSIRHFTPMAERIFNLIPSDIGRRLTDMNRSILAPDLDLLLEQVVKEWTPLERDVQDSSGHRYSLRLRPYRTHDNKITGAVVLLVDMGSSCEPVQSLSHELPNPTH